LQRLYRRRAFAKFHRGVAQRKHLARAQKSQFESSVAIRGESVATQVGTYLVVPSTRDPAL